MNAKSLLANRGMSQTLLIFGVAFLIVVVALSQLLVNPPPAEAAPKPAAGAPAAAAVASGDYTPTEMLKTPQFYLAWLMYAFNAGAGLMIIGQLAPLVKLQTNSDAGFILVALLAVGNAGGRLLAGSLSDKLGRYRVMQIFTMLQAVLMFVTPFVTSQSGLPGPLYILVVISMLIGMCYGSNLALFPSITKDYYGLKNFGMNYGFIFTAWGVGSLLALVAGKIKDQTGVYDKALYLAGILLVVSFVISFVMKKPEPKSA